jgi:hypothetical protein
MVGRADLVLAAAVGAVVVVAGVTAVVVAERDVPQPPAGSPQAVVRDYLGSLASGDLTGALEQLEPGSDCGLDDLAQAYLPDSLRVVLESTEGDDEATVVTVAITENPDEDLLGSGGWSHDERILLTRTDGAWWITGEPWPMYACTSGGSR